MLEFGFESFVLSQNIVVPLESVMLLLDVRQSENVPRCCKRLDFFCFLLACTAQSKKPVRNGGRHLLSKSKFGAMWKLVLLGLPWASFSDLSSTGLPTCPCVKWANLGQYQVGNVIRYTPKGQDTGYDYALNYGNLECKAHDSRLPPFCDVESPPAWCAQK